MSPSSISLPVVMYFTKSLFLVCFMMMPVLGMSGSYQQGVALAQSNPIPQPGGPEAVPGYAGADLPQSQINPQDLGGEALKASQANEASKLIAENSERGERFVIDPHTDPLVLAGNQIIADPQKVLDEQIIESKEGGDWPDEIKTCEEGGDEYTQKCSKYLTIELKVTPEISYNYRYCPGQHRGWGRDAPAYSCYSRDCAVASGISQHKKVDIVKEEWVDGCAVLESLAEKGLCRYISKSTSPKNEIRTIDNEPITRDHFEEHYEYACIKTSPKSCGGLRAKGCFQIKSVCKEKKGEVCVLWEQTYRCPPSKINGTSYRSSNTANPFCLSGDCADKSYVPNQDFAEVMSRLSVLKEAGDDLRNFGVIFKGLDRRCTRHCVDFKDCCGNGEGWGVSLKLASCDAEEKELAELRKKNRCVQVGTYCAEKILGVCIRKKTTFCCYGTKLAKIIQEQGRGQLGLGFGSPEKPQCQGLTPDQLSKIDFSKINFANILSEVVDRTKTPNPEKLILGIKKSMVNKGSLLKPSIKGIKEGPLTTSSAQGTQRSNEPLASLTLPGNTLETTTKPENLQVQGCSHGQF